MFAAIPTLRRGVRRYVIETDQRSLAGSTLELFKGARRCLLVRLWVEYECRNRDLSELRWFYRSPKRPPCSNFRNANSLGDPLCRG